MNKVWLIATTLTAYFITNAIMFTANWAVPDTVYAEEYQKAVQVCHKNEGLDFIELDSNLHDVHCNDGAVFPDAIQESGRVE